MTWLPVTRGGYRGEQLPATLVATGDRVIHRVKRRAMGGRPKPSTTEDLDRMLGGNREEK